MKKAVGLWIDHKRAVIVTISGDSELITNLASNVERNDRDIPASLDVAPEDQRDRRFMDHLSKYYDEVISHIRDAMSILILGPGEAKGEFAKQLKKEGLGACIVGVETADKMTDRQIAAIVRQHYQPKH